MFNILEQFENTPIFNIFSVIFFSNTAFYVIQFYVIFLFLYIPNNYLISKYYIPYFTKFLYMFNIDLLNTNGLLKQYNVLITFFFFLPQVIFLVNISGIFTYPLTLTSQIVLTFFSSSIIFFGRFSGKHLLRNTSLILIVLLFLLFVYYVALLLLQYFLFSCVILCVSLYIWIYFDTPKSSNWSSAFFTKKPLSSNFYDCDLSTKKRIYGVVSTISGNHMPRHPAYVCIDSRLKEKFGIMFGTTPSNYNTQIPVEGFGKSKYYSILSYCNIRNKLIHPETLCRIVPPRTDFFKKTPLWKQGLLFNKLVSHLHEENGSLTTLTGEKVICCPDTLSMINKEIEILESYYDNNILLRNPWMKDHLLNIVVLSSEWFVVIQYLLFGFLFLYLYKNFTEDEFILYKNSDPVKPSYLTISWLYLLLFLVPLYYYHLIFYFYLYMIVMSFVACVCFFFEYLYHKKNAKKFSKGTIVIFAMGFGVYQDKLVNFVDSRFSLETADFLLFPFDLIEKIILFPFIVVYNQLFFFFSLKINSQKLDWKKIYKTFLLKRAFALFFGFPYIYCQILVFVVKLLEYNDPAKIFFYKINSIFYSQYHLDVSINFSKKK